MLSNHPSAEDLQDFLTKPRDRLRNEWVVRHLLADCQTCRSQLDRLGWTKRRVDRLFSLPLSEAGERQFIPSAVSYNYDKAFSNAEATLSAFLEEGRPVEHPPPEILAELIPLSLDGTLLPLSSENQAQVAPLVKWLIQRSHAARYESPERTLELAHLARLAVDACSAKTAGGEQRLADLQAQAWSQFGNALRICGRLHEAEEALAKAQSCLEAGTEDPALLALWLQRMSSLHMWKRKIKSAIDFADEAIQLYEELGETNSMASALVQKAIAMLYGGAAAEAARILEQAIPKIDPEDDPYLLVAARHNLMRCYIDLDQPQIALSLYYKLRESNKELKDPLILLRIAWQEGQLLRDLGHLYKAEAALVRARKGFMERGLAYEVAVVSFDLASVYAKQGRTEEVRQMVSDTIPIFRALRIGREMIAALIQLTKIPAEEPDPK